MRSTSRRLAGQPLALIWRTTDSAIQRLSNLSDHPRPFGRDPAIETHVQLGACSVQDTRSDRDSLLLQALQSASLMFRVRIDSTHHDSANSRPDIASVQGGVRPLVEHGSKVT